MIAFWCVLACCGAFGAGMAIGQGDASALYRETFRERVALLESIRAIAAAYLRSGDDAMSLEHAIGKAFALVLRIEARSQPRDASKRAL